MREVLPIRSRRLDRARRVQTIQHVLAAVILILNAYDHLTDPLSHHVVLPVLEMITGLILIGTAIVERVRKTHARVGWFELAGATMLYVEAIAKLQDRHHLSFHILTFIAPTILLLFGIFDTRIREGLRMEANDDAFLVKTRVFRWYRVPWDKLQSYRFTDKHLELIRTDGRITRINLSDLHNADEARAWADKQLSTALSTQHAALRPAPPPSSAC